MNLSRVALASLFCLGFAKCSSGPKILTDGGPPESLDQRIEVSRLWERELPGLLSDLAAADPGKGWVASSIPDPERDGNEKKSQVIRVGMDGNFLWKAVTTKKIRALAISPDGEKVAHSTYEGELTLLDTKGKVSWAVPAPCSPRFVALKGALACWHDDDTAPGSGFEMRAMRDGARAAEVRAGSDLLAFEVSPDQTHAALGIAGGELRVVKFAEGKTPETAATWKVSGEIAALSIAGSPPKVAVLLQPKIDRVRANQEVRVYAVDAPAGPVYSKPILIHADQLVLDGGNIRLHGNGTSGQAFFSMAWKKDEGTDWSAQFNSQADYAPSLRTAGGLVFGGFEDKGRIALAVRDTGGTKVAEFPLALVGGAYLYTAQEEAGGSVLLMIGTDAGKLTAYRLRLK